MAGIKGWFTMNGMHIPIMEGQSRAEAAKNYISYNKKIQKNAYKKVEEAKRLKAEKEKLHSTKISDEEALDAYAKSSYNLGKEAGWVDKDTSFEDYKKEFVEHKGNMAYFNDNKEGIKNSILRQKESNLKTFDELDDKSKEHRYKDAALKYTCGNYIDVINYQQGKQVKGDLKDIKKTTEALEYMSTKGGFDIESSMYRGLQDVSVKGLKAGDIIAMRPTVSSWTDDIQVAKRFSTDNKNSVILVNKNGHYGDINYYSNSLRQESECIMSSTRNKFKITDIKQEGNTTYVYTDQSFYKEK